MITDTVLTDERIKEIAFINDSSIYTMRSHNDIALARAIEQAVLQSPEARRLWEDAGRYRWLRRSDTGPATLDSLHSWVNDDCNPPYRELKYGNDLDTAIDAALEKQP